MPSHYKSDKKASKKGGSGKMPPAMVKRMEMMKKKGSKK